MNDLGMRFVLAIVAGFTYLAGAVGADVTFSQLGSLPVSTWLLFVVNLLTAFASPSLIKNVAGGNNAKNKFN